MADEPIKVIQWATGTVGIHAVPGIVAHPALELVGLWVHSDAKAGQDAGTLCGIDPVGVIATQDADALLALDADVICYTASSDIRPDAVVDDLCRMLAGGKHVVGTSFVPLLYPAAAGDGVLERLDEAAGALDGPAREDLLVDLYGVERHIRSASRRLTRAVGGLPQSQR